MSRPKQSEAARIVKFFREATPEAADLIYGLVKDAMLERKSSGSAPKPKKAKAAAAPTVAEDPQGIK
jgi:hypothetical protein